MQQEAEASPSLSQQATANDSQVQACKNTTRNMKVLCQALARHGWERVLSGENGRLAWHWGKMLSAYLTRFESSVVSLPLLKLLAELITQLIEVTRYREDIYPWYEKAMKALAVLPGQEHDDITQMLDSKLEVASAKLLHYQNDRIPWPAFTASTFLPPRFEQTLIALDKYHKGRLSRSMLDVSEAGLTKLEASFLYRQGQAFLLKTLAHPLSAVEQKRHLQAAEHIGTLLNRAGYYREACEWYYDLYQLDSLAAFSERLLWAYGQSYFALVAPESPVLEPVESESDWQRYRAKLDKYRSCLKETLGQDSAAGIQGLTRFNEQVVRFVCKLWQESVDLLGLPLLPVKGQQSTEPVKFCILALGSMSRGMLGAYSDLEYAILVAQASDADWEGARAKGSVEQQRAYYLKTLTEVFEFKVRSIGETDTGFCLDNNSQPRTEFAMRGTPLSLVKQCLSGEVEAKDGLVYSLVHAKYLYGELKLWQDYQDTLNQTLVGPCPRPDGKDLSLLSTSAQLPWHRYWVSAQFSRNEEEYEKYCLQPDDPESAADLKKPYSKLLCFILLDMALYHHLPAYDLKTVVEQLRYYQILPEGYLTALTQALKTVLLERSRLALERGKQDDSALPSHGELLQSIRQKLFAPFFKAIPLLKTHNSACFQQALWLAQASNTLLLPPTACQVKLLEQDYVTGHYFLPSHWVEKVFTATGEITRAGEDRNSAVFFFDHYCLKIIQPEDSSAKKQREALSVFITREYAVQQLSQLLDFKVIPPGCALQLTYSAQGTSRTYYGWLCQEVVGSDLFKAVSAARSPSEQDAFMAAIDPASYSALFILSLLSYGQDGQPRNFVIHSAPDQQHLSIWLMSVDNKRSFVSPLTSVTGVWRLFTDRPEVNIKNALYLLPLFTAACAESVIAQCQQVAVAALTEAWLKRLLAFDNYVGQVLGGSAQATPYGFSHLALERFLVHAIPLRFRQLREKLAKGCSHALLLQTLEPDLYRIYQVYRDKVTLASFYKYFKEDYRIDQYGQGFSQRSAGFIRDRGLQRQELGNSLWRTYPAFFEQIRWPELDKEEQYQLLTLMKGHAFQRLHLAGCEVLTESDLRQLLRTSPQLTYLDVSDCPTLGESLFDLIAAHKVQLLELRCDGNMHLTTVVIPSRLKQLEQLSLQHCHHLTQVDVSRVPQLEFIYLDGSKKVNISDIKYKRYEEFIYPNSSIRVKFRVPKKYKRYERNFYIRGLVKYELGQYQEAIKDFEQAIHLTTLYKSYKVDKHQAEKDIYQILNLLRSRYFFYRGLIKHNLGQYEKANKDYDRAIEERNPIHFWVYSSNSKIADQMQRMNEEKRIEMQSNPYYKKNCRFSLSQYQLAIRRRVPGISIDPQEVVYIACRGASRYMLGHYRDAVRDFEQALSFDYAYDTFKIRSVALEQYSAALMAVMTGLSYKPQQEEMWQQLLSIAAKVAGFTSENFKKLQEEVNDNQLLAVIPPKVKATEDLLRLIQNVLKTNKTKAFDPPMSLTTATRIQPLTTTSADEELPPLLSDDSPQVIREEQSKALTSFAAETSFSPVNSPDQTKSKDKGKERVYDIEDLEEVESSTNENDHTHCQLDNEVVAAAEESQLASEENDAKIVQQNEGPNTFLAANITSSSQDSPTYIHGLPHSSFFSTTSEHKAPESTEEAAKAMLSPSQRP